MKKIALLLVLALSFIFVGCTSKANTTTAGMGRIVVYTSIYPLYDFAGKVGGNRIELNNIIPPGGEPHGWEPAPRDIARMSGADVLILCGAGMETWAGRVFDNLNNPKTIVVDSSLNVNLIKQSPEHGHDHNTYSDPHIWLDPLNAQIMVDNITAALVQADGANKAFYQQNALSFKKELEKLHLEYKDNLANTRIKEFITSHEAFGYLAKRYGLNQVAIRGVSPELEPSPAVMTKIIKIAREKEIKHIFFEGLVSPKVSEAIAREIGAETLILDPLDGMTETEIKSGQDYLYGMRENLQNLKKALN